MTPATEIAMEIAQLKLRLRQLTNKYRGTHGMFDAAIEQAVKALDNAILNSSDAVSEYDMTHAILTVSKGMHVSDCR